MPFGTRYGYAVYVVCLHPFRCKCHASWRAARGTRIYVATSVCILQYKVQCWLYVHLAHSVPEEEPSEDVTQKNMDYRLFAHRSFSRMSPLEPTDVNDTPGEGCL